MSTSEKATRPAEPGSLPDASTEPVVGAVPSTQPSHHDSSLREGEIIGSRFKLTTLLGAGGQGEVWRAEDLEITGHVVALKLLFDRARTPDQKEMQLRELRMLASVSHPAVCQFKEHGWLGGRLWFVMPFLAGKSLEDRMPLTRAEARRIFETLAGGLSAVHAKGLRHQDIKPANIFLAEVAGLDEPMPVLLDFGVAAKEGEVLVAGSPDYFAPELAAEWPIPEHVGPESDVFALALALRNALEPSTAPTMDAFDPASLARRGKELIAPPSAPDLAFLAPSFSRWLAIDPGARPTASKLRTELEVLTGPEDRKRERARVARRVAPWAAISVVLAGAGGWWSWAQLVEARKATAAEAAESEEARRETEAAETRATTLGSRLDEALGLADESARRSEDALGRLDDAEAAIGRAEGSAEAMRVARDRLRAALADARTEIEAQAASLLEAHDSVARLGAELESAQADLASTRRALAAARTSLSETETQLAAARADLERTTAERDARASDLASARARVTELETRASTLETRVTSAETARDGSEASARAAEAARDAATTSLRTAEDRAGRLDGRVTELEGEVRSLRRDLEDARSRGGGGGVGGSSGSGGGGGVVHGGPLGGGEGPLGGVEVGGVPVPPARP